MIGVELDTTAGVGVAFESSNCDHGEGWLSSVGLRKSDGRMTGFFHDFPAQFISPDYVLGLCEMMTAMTRMRIVRYEYVLVNLIEI